MATTGQRKKQGVKPIIEQAELADVIETTRNGETTQTIKYKAPIKQDDEVTETTDENANENQDFSFENDNQGFNLEFAEIPKDKIDVIFDDLENDFSAQDYFYAKLTRIPDAMQDSFYIHCASEMPLGVFQFSLQDRFSFIPAIQKRNNNSGGRFNIAIYDSQQKQVKVRFYNFRNQAEIREVGAVNLLIPNPVREETKDAPNGLENIFAKMIEIQQQNHNQLMQVIQNQNQNQGKTTSEFVQEIAAIKQLFPEPKQSDFMQQMLTMPVMMETFAASWREAMKKPETPAPAERTTFDKVLEVMQLPIVSNAIEKATDILDAVAAVKLEQNQPAQNWQTAPEQIQQNPQELNAGNNQNDDMKVIIETLIVELESESPIDNTNQTIQRLKQEYGQAFNMVSMMCKSAPFPDVLNLLITQSVTIQPFPFAPFIDAEKMKENGNTAYAYTERGEKAIKRLEQVYNFLRES